MAAPTIPVLSWWYWDRERWTTINEADRAGLKPDITCVQLQGEGALDPRLTLAVGDARSMEVAKQMHRRFRMRGQA